MTINDDDATVEQLLHAILYRLRAIHMALVDPAEARRQFDEEMVAVEKRRAEAEAAEARTNGAELH